MFKCKQLLRRICVVSYVFLLCGALVNASNLVSKTNTLIGTQGNGWASGYLYPASRGLHRTCMHICQSCCWRHIYYFLVNDLLK